MLMFSFILQHAVAMALFARDIVRKMREVVKKLETKLGPDTGDLALRVGLNSGRTYHGTHFLAAFRHADNVITHNPIPLTLLFLLYSGHGRCFEG